MRIIIILLCASLFKILTGCSGETKPIEKKITMPAEKEIYGPSNPNYTMNVTYDSKSHTLSGTMSVEFENNLDHTLDHIYFNLWPNAKFFKEGGINVDRVRFNDKNAQYKVKGTVLDISGIQFKKDEQATVAMDFNVTVPEGVNRFGWHGTGVMLGNWFPILAVYDHNGWNLNPYFEDGESFYSLTGNFDVTLTTDEREVVAATGETVRKTEKQSGMVAYEIKASDVRDFAIAMNTAYHVKSENEGPVKINVYYTDEQKDHLDELMGTGHYALSNYNVLFGDYPWPELDIVTMEPTWFAGMEYPQLVMISLRENSNTYYVYQTTEHEIAHQWFYGVVGNNEYESPWLDESFATFATNVVFNSLDTLDAAVPPVNNIYNLTSPASLFAAHEDSGGDKAYNQTIYFYGARTLNDLREKLGDGTFYKGLQAYYKEMKFGVATTRDFIRIMEKTSGKDLTGFFNEHRVYETE